jgi:hypothetical protein
MYTHTHTHTHTYHLRPGPHIPGRTSGTQMNLGIVDLRTVFRV